ncbi:MAG: S8 family serine peptidase, partial [Candidatus Kapaibacterium sp.]
MVVGLFDNSEYYYESEQGRRKIEHPSRVAVVIGYEEAENAEEVISQIEAERNLTRIVRSYPDNVGYLYDLPSSSDAAFNDFASAMHEVNGVVCIGLVLSQEDGRLSIVTRVIHARFNAEITSADVPSLAASYGLVLTNEIGMASCLYTLSSDMVPWLGLVELCNTMVADGNAIYAYPMPLVVGNKIHNVSVDDYLYPMQWHLSLIRVDDAWELLRGWETPAIGSGNLTFGSADIIAAVYDVGGIPIGHPDFTGNVRGGSLTNSGVSAAKVYQRINFDTKLRADEAQKGVVYTEAQKKELARVKPHASISLTIPEAAEGKHGTNCSGLLGALANNGSGGPAGSDKKEGIVGVAPNIRLISINTSPDRRSDSIPHLWRYLVGLEPRWKADKDLYPSTQVFPPSLGGRSNLGAAIISISMTMKSESVDMLQAALSEIAWFGRRRRGTVVLYSAGNDNNNVTTINTLADRGKLIIVAGSSPTHDGSEIRTSYSNWARRPNSETLGTMFVDRGLRPHAMLIDVAAPTAPMSEFRCYPFSTVDNLLLGGPELHFVHHPPVAWGVITTAGKDSDGNLSSHITFTTDLKEEIPPTPQGAPLPLSFVISATANSIDLSTVFTPGKAVFIGDPDDLTAESNFVWQTEALSGGKLKVWLRNQILQPHQLPTSIHVTGSSKYISGFSGTSASCPIVSGVVALMLSANSALTNIEVRELLRRTAIKINLRGDDPQRDNRSLQWVGYTPRNDSDPERDIPPGCDANSLFEISFKGRSSTAFEFNAYTNAVTSLTAPAEKGQTKIFVADRSLLHRGQAIILGAQTSVSENGIKPNRGRIRVQNPIGFHQGQRIRIGYWPRTYAVGVGPNDVDMKSVYMPTSYDRSKLFVGSTRGFREGQKIIVGNDPTIYRIDRVVSADFKTIDPPDPADESPAPKFEVKPVPCLLVSPGFNESKLWSQTVAQHAQLDDHHPFASAPMEVRLAYSLDTVVAAIPEDETLTIDLVDLIPTSVPLDGLDYASVETWDMELTYIQDIPPADGSQNSDKAIIVPPLVYDHQKLQTEPAIRVAGGRIPYYNWGLGFGRVDAAAAVQAAHDYNHDERDLMIRKDLGDTGGVRFTGKINTPDLWLCNGDCTEVSLKTPKTKLGPHGTGLKFDQPKQIFARITNRGTKHESLDAAVRFYIGIMDGGHIPSVSEFRQWLVPQLDDDKHNKIFMDWGLSTDYAANGMQYLGEERIYPITNPGDIKATRIRRSADQSWTDGYGIPPGKDFVVMSTGGVGTNLNAIKLPSGARLGSGRRFFLMAEITPHDGIIKEGNNILDGSEDIRNNSNLVFRELAFTDMSMKYRDGAHEDIPNRLFTSRSGDSTEIDFTLRLRDLYSYFLAEKVSLIATAVRAGVKSSVNLSYDVTPEHPDGWHLDTVADWIAFDQLTPLTLYPSGGDPGEPGPSPVTASGDVFDIYFTGTVAIDKTWQGLTVEAVIMNGDDIEIARDKWTAAIQEEMVDYDELASEEFAVPGLCTFTAIADLDLQSDPAKAFGPQSESQFRVTTSFTSSVADLPVYAVTSGVALVQRVVKEDGSLDDQTVNLIISPKGGSSIDFKPVKYFVYRGLKIGDFLGGTGYSEVREMPPDGNNDGISAFIKQIHKNAQIRYEESAGANPNAPDVPNPAEGPLSSKVLGWDPGEPDVGGVPVPPIASTNDMLLERFFRTVGSTVQLPYVPRGMHLGNFNTDGSEFGFEIVLEGNHGKPLTLAYARSAVHVIDVVVEAADSESAERFRREDVLNFIDVAAYYGMHADVGVELPDGSRIEPENVYGAVLAPFINRNRVYIDIRNEADYSMNYYDNYDPYGTQLKIGNEIGTMIEDRYDSNGWPIGFIERFANGQQNSNGDSLYMSLLVADNIQPALYVERGKLVTPAIGRFVSDTSLKVEDEPWTLPFGFKLRQITLNSETRDIADIIKFRYLRQLPAESQDVIANVVAAESYTDNIFGPIDAGPTWGMAVTASPLHRLQTISWQPLYERRYVDARNAGHGLTFGAVVERGIVIQGAHVLFYDVAVDFLNADGAVVTGTKGIEGGFSAQQNFFSASSLFD